MKHSMPDNDKVSMLVLKSINGLYILNTMLKTVDGLQNLSSGSNFLWLYELSWSFKSQQLWKNKLTLAHYLFWTVGFL